MPGYRVPGNGEWLDVGWNLGCIPEKSIVLGYIFPSGSSVVQVFYLSEQVYVSRLPLHEFLQFAEKVCDPLYRGWV